jgi:hypothetical protein
MQFEWFRQSRKHRSKLEEVCFSSSFLVIFHMTLIQEHCSRDSPADFVLDAVKRYLNCLCFSLYAFLNQTDVSAVAGLNEYEGLFSCSVALLGNCITQRSIRVSVTVNVILLKSVCMYLFLYYVFIVTSIALPGNVSINTPRRAHATVRRILKSG